jgi:quercetin dioxygenase-like cupin family protein
MPQPASAYRPARDVSFEGNRMIVLVSSDETDGALALLDETVPADWAPPLHIHHLADEVLYGLEGSYLFKQGDETIAASVGDHVVVRRGTPHSWVSGPDGGRMLIAFAPGGTETYFAELAAALARGPAGEAFHRRAKERFGMEVLE